MYVCMYVCMYVSSSVRFKIRFRFRFKVRFKDGSVPVRSFFCCGGCECVSCFIIREEGYLGYINF